ncbi:MAG: export transporter periplasmic protein LptC, partial [Acidobacteriota bacterium]|nr:export transporter periplasmic protein LptC [Acidobacteriota bacterium]
MGGLVINSFLMKEKKFIPIIFVVFIVAVGLSTLYAQERGKDRQKQSQQQQQQQQTSEIKVNAQNQYMDENKLIASGNVEIAWEDYRFFADYLEFNQDTKELMAKGRVTMSSKETIITGEKLTFNLKDRSGEIYDTYGQMPPTIRYTTDKLSQVDNNTLTFKKLDFTSCTQCVPRWKITCSKGKIKKEKYIEMSNVLFKIKKVPIFYLPYLRYPVDKDGRATGILMPNFGTSSLRGFFLLNAFFWAIKPNVDLTLYFDYYAKAGIGMAEEFRYLFRQMDGHIKFYLFKYKKDNIVGAEKSSDYYLKWEHKQRINFLNTRITIAIDRQSDANFLRLFSNNFDSVLTRMSRSQASIDSSFANVRLSISGMQNDTFYTFANKSTRLSYLPQIKLNWNQQKLWVLPGYFSLAASYTTVERVGKTYDEDELIYVSDVSSTRFSLNPSYMLGLLRFPWLNAYLAMETQYTYYPKSKDPNAKGVVILDEPLQLYYHSANLTIKGPV